MWETGGRTWSSLQKMSGFDRKHWQRSLLTVDMDCTVSITTAQSSCPDWHPANVTPGTSNQGCDGQISRFRLRTILHKNQLSESRGVFQGSGGHGLTSVAGSGQAGGVTAAGWASVENQEDIADLAVVNAPPTDWPESIDGKRWDFIYRWCFRHFLWAELRDTYSNIFLTHGLPGLNHAATGRDHCVSDLLPSLAVLYRAAGDKQRKHQVHKPEIVHSLHPIVSGFFSHLRNIVCDSVVKISLINTGSYRGTICWRLWMKPKAKERACCWRSCCHSVTPPTDSVFIWLQHQRGTSPAERELAARLDASDGRPAALAFMGHRADPANKLRLLGACC